MKKGIAKIQTTRRSTQAYQDSKNTSNMNNLSRTRSCIHGFTMHKKRGSFWEPKCSQSSGESKTRNNTRTDYVHSWGTPFSGASTGHCCGKVAIATWGTFCDDACMPQSYLDADENTTVSNFQRHHHHRSI